MTLTPKEKAKYLFSSYLYEFNEDFKNRWLAKKCALIAVDEILEAIPSEYLDEWKGETYMAINEDIEYWQQVKQEIQAL
jgi:hypothetical protein